MHIIIPCINNVALLVFKYPIISTSPDAIHVTIVLFSSEFPGIVRLEFCVPTPYVIIPRSMMEESVERNNSNSIPFHSAHKINKNKTGHAHLRRYPHTCPYALFVHTCGCEFQYDQ